RCVRENTAGSCVPRGPPDGRQRRRTLRSRDHPSSASGGLLGSRPGYGTSVLASSHANISPFTIDGSSEAAPPPYTAPLRAGVAGGFLAYSTPAAMSLTKRDATPGSVCGRVTHR